MNITSQFSISGITCEACIKLISRRVLPITGVKDIKISLSGETAIIADRQIESVEISKVLGGTDYQIN